MGRKRLIKDKWQIVETAFEMIKSEGINSISTRKLAKKLGISTMTLYNYVPDMAAIEKEVVLLGFNKLYGLILKEIENKKDEIKSGGIRSVCRISAWEKIAFAEKFKEIYILMYDPRKTELKKDLELMPYYRYFQKIPMVLNVDEGERKSISKSIRLFDFIINGIIIDCERKREKCSKKETDELINHALNSLFP